MIDMPCQFDSKSFTSLLYTTDAELSREDIVKCINANRKSFNESFKKIKEKRLKELYDAKLQDDIKLHEGFNKSCGLKGSKLSGGQK